ncbi:hypothetical protein LOTGIDRAFT_104391 [Lottia gigantea]|uniref:ODAD1 central coiled coil region domain-containing protein n=1 Tax=Lottia gigantea TaxID=225164 RepID=V4A1P7_LOTGI|nr:hypothetical protein LOTGIDRAFT_104391 [Lottia gigantea]ESO97753.1 hypothetical protein LOTGIDRAFT_104391 [Lottia gigantea]
MVRRDDPDSDNEVCEEAALEAALEADKARLLRQLRVMESDKRAYAEETGNIIRKQKSQIKTLLREDKELGTVLKLAQSDKNCNLDENNTYILQHLVELKDEYELAGEEEKKKIAELDVEIKKMEKELAQQRKANGSDTCVSAEMMIRKRTRVLENRLGQSTVKFNEQLAINTKQRKLIDHSRQERNLFTSIFNKLDKELQQLRKEMSQFIEEASQAYEQRDEAYNKMVALKERSEKDQAQYDLEMKELQRFIDHDNKLKEFMMIKANDRAEFKEEEEAKKKKSETAQIETYEEAAQEIRNITGEQDFAAITSEFLRKENENFALFSFVNELNNEVEKLQEDISTTKQEIQRFEEDDVKMEAERRDFLLEFETQSKIAKQETELAVSRISECSDKLNKLTEGVNSLFSGLKCDSSAIKEMLGSEDGVTEKNILLYMGIIEHRTMELLHIIHYIDMKVCNE